MDGTAPRVRQGQPDGSVPSRQPDLVVVGGGAAGLAAAAAGRSAGAAVTLVSEGPLGGDCTWHGCVPSKSLLEAAAAGAPPADAVAHARAVVARVARGEDEHALATAGTDVVRSRATLQAGAVLALADGTLLRPRLGVVLATGSVPAPVDGLASAAGGRVHGTDSWLDGLQAHLGRAAGVPGDVVVVGGGPTGVELAQALARLGAAGPGGTVTLLEQADGLLPDVPGAGAVLARALAGDGVRVRAGAGPEVLAAAAAGAGLVLVAGGRRPATGVLGPAAGVRTEHGAVVVDRTMATTAPRVRAAGDLVGLSPSTHVAVATGRVAAAGLLGVEGADPVAFDAAWVPRVVWTDPQVAVVGRTDGVGARSVRLPLSRNDRAPAAAVPGRPARARGGFARLWLEGEEGGGRVVGAVAVGPQAGEGVAEVALVGRLGLTVAGWVGGRPGLGGLSAHHPYPAWSWTWALLADKALGE